MKKVKFQIKSVFGEVLFEYEAENNTLRKTIEKAVNSSANLRSADLRYADLSSADLRYANLRSADLSYADLSSANLRSADLSSADLSSANLRSADLSSANLSSADLRYANLSSANLSSANLRSADLSSANLSSANLRSADLKKFYHLFTIVPQEGSFIAWKSLNNGCIAKIEIPAKAKRVSHLASRKCRASYVKTLAIYDRNGNEIKEACGRHDNNTTYKVGRLTKPDKYDPSPLVDCSGGIHFFLTKEEALEW